jgi:V/A-type H+/Na+-transporting ATPase subunit D
MSDRELATTRIALLELGEERRTAQEGYALLDEKRMLLAARALALAASLAERRREWDEAWAAAVDALRDTLDRHGVQALETWPCTAASLHLELREARVLGLRLPEAVARMQDERPELPAPTRDPRDIVALGSPSTIAAPSDPSPEAAECGLAWRALLERGAALAALETSLWRLVDEYRRTERRTAAIEHVLMPELDAAISTIAQALEAIDQEEAIRVRRARAR